MENKLLVAILVASIIVGIFSINGYKGDKTSAQLDKEIVWTETHQTIRH